MDKERKFVFLGKTAELFTVDGILLGIQERARERLKGKQRVRQSSLFSFSPCLQEYGEKGKRWRNLLEKRWEDEGDWVQYILNRDGYRLQKESKELAEVFKALGRSYMLSGETYGRELVDTLISRGFLTMGRSYTGKIYADCRSYKALIDSAIFEEDDSYKREDEFKFPGVFIDHQEEADEEFFPYFADFLITIEEKNGGKRGVFVWEITASGCISPKEDQYIKPMSHLLKENVEVVGVDEWGLEKQMDTLFRLFRAGDRYALEDMIRNITLFDRGGYLLKYLQLYEYLLSFLLFAGNKYDILYCHLITPILCTSFSSSLYEDLLENREKLEEAYRSVKGIKSRLKKEREKKYGGSIPDAQDLWENFKRENSRLLTEGIKIDRTVGEIRREHEETVKRALKGDYSIIVDASAPGIGKTSIIVNLPGKQESTWLGERLIRGDRFALIYISPRKEVNKNFRERAEETLEELSSFRKGRVEPFTPESGSMDGQAYRYITCTVRRGVRETKLTEMRGDGAKEKRPGNFKQVVSKLEEVRNDPDFQGVIITTTIQSLRRHALGSTREHLENAVKAAVESKDGLSFSQVLFFVDEVTGSSEGMEVAEVLAESILKFGKGRVKLFIADASISSYKGFAACVRANRLGNATPFISVSDPDTSAHRRASLCEFREFSCEDVWGERCKGEGVFINSSYFPASCVRINPVFHQIKEEKKKGEDEEEKRIEIIKNICLAELEAMEEDEQLYVFFQSRMGVSSVRRALEKHGYECGEFTSTAHNEDLEAELKKKVVICTSTTSRGVSVRRGTRCVLVLPSFSPEQNMAELVQASYRMRGEYDDREKKITLVCICGRNCDPLQEMGKLIISLRALETRIRGRTFLSVSERDTAVVPIPGFSVPPVESEQLFTPLTVLYRNFLLILERETDGFAEEYINSLERVLKLKQSSDTEESLPYSVLARVVGHLLVHRFRDRDVRIVVPTEESYHTGVFKIVPFMSGQKAEAQRVDFWGSRTERDEKIKKLTFLLAVLKKILESVEKDAAVDEKILVSRYQSYTPERMRKLREGLKNAYTIYSALREIWEESVEDGAIEFSAGSSLAVVYMLDAVAEPSPSGGTRFSSAVFGGLPLVVDAAKDRTEKEKEQCGGIFHSFILARGADLQIVREHLSSLSGGKGSVILPPSTLAGFLI